MPPSSNVSRHRRCRGEGVESEERRVIDVDCRVARDDDAPARSSMRDDDASRRIWFSVVERAGRFVEKPHRSRGCDHPGERQPAALTRRKPAARPIGNSVERERGERRVQCRRFAGAPLLPRSATQNAIVSRGVSPGLTPS